MAARGDIDRPRAGFAYSLPSMVFHEPSGAGRGGTARAIYRGIAAVLLVTAAAACGRSELDGGDGFDDGGAAGRAGGTSTGGRAGGVSTGGVSGSGASGGIGVGGVANSSGIGGGAASGGASGRAGSSGASGNAGSSGASGGAGSSGTSGSGGAFENCTNGVDDDHDGNIDCADPDCGAGFTCAPSTPGGGWVGPLAVWQGSGTPPSCASANGFPTEVTNGMRGSSGTPASSCPSCSCGAPQGVSCQVGTAALFRDNTCSGQPGTLTVAEGNCAAFVSLSYDPASVRWASAPASGGACVPTTSGSAVHPPISWDSQLRACGDPMPNAGGCAAGLCVPRQKMPFGQALCIYQRSDLACPAGPYSVKSLYFSHVNDTRKCSACDCASPTGTTCSGTLKLYTDLTCSVDETTLSTVLECSSLAPDPTPPSPPYMSLRSMIYTGTADPGGECPVQPSTTSCAVIADEPITVCCTP